MSDLVQDAKYLRYYYTSEETLLDKDITKNETFKTFSNKVTALFMVPLGFQFWQMYLVNNFEKAALYNKVRMLKAITFAGAVAISFFEKTQLEKQWTYLNRMYPEPTELQKTLYRDAMMFKELDYKEKSVEERTQLDTETTKIYEQLYRLPAQSTPEPDEDPNPPTIKTHY